MDSNIVPLIPPLMARLLTWQEIAEEINRDTGSSLTGRQARHIASRAGLSYTREQSAAMSARVMAEKRAQALAARPPEAFPLDPEIMRATLAAAIAMPDPQPLAAIAARYGLKPATISWRLRQCGLRYSPEAARLLRARGLAPRRTRPEGAPPKPRGERRPGHVRSKEADDREYARGMQRFSRRLLDALIKAVINGAEGAPLPLVALAAQEVDSRWSCVRNKHGI